MSKEESKIEMALAKKDPFKAMGIIPSQAQGPQVLSPGEKEVVSPRIFEQDGETNYKHWNRAECIVLIKEDPKNLWAHLRQGQLFIEDSKFHDSEETI